MTTITPDAPQPGDRYVVQKDGPGGYDQAAYWADYPERFQKGDVVVIDEDAEVDGDGDVFVRNLRTDRLDFVAFADLAPEELVAPITEADVEAFAKAIEIEPETVEVVAMIDALVDMGLDPVVAEATVALAIRRSKA